MSRSIKKHSTMGSSYGGQKVRKSLKLDKKNYCREERIKSKDTLKKVVLDFDNDIVFPITKQYGINCRKFYSPSPNHLFCSEYKSDDELTNKRIESYNKYLRK